jgi:hypothetical protein
VRVSKKYVKRLGIEIRESTATRGRKPRKRDDNQGRDRLFDAACLAHNLPVPIHEYRWHPVRKWRFDYLFDFVAVEKVGGVWVNGHHSRGKTQLDDMARRNEAQIMGFLVLEFSPQQFEDGSAFETIRRALAAEGERA